jgi:hypothetical protein
MTMITNSSSVPGDIKDIVIPERGLFRLVWEEALPNPVEGIREQDLYQPFAQYLTDELEECSKAVPLGGSSRVDLQACKLGTGRRFTTS